jgi:hypothetical protein
MVEESEEQRRERLEDEEFARTGSFSVKLNIEFDVTEADMQKDLVKKTEGKNIKVKKPSSN